MNYFATNLKFLIKRFGIKQGDLATQVKKQQTTISNWINRVSEPDVSQLLIIHQYFGISIDALVKTNLSATGLVTDAHVEEFKRLGAAGRELTMNAKAVSKQYLIDDAPPPSLVSEPDAVASWAFMGQFKQIHEKLDDLQDSVNEIARHKKS